MDAGRGSYLCGLVLGVAVGVAATHVALSGRSSHAPVHLPDLAFDSPALSSPPRIDAAPLTGLTPELKTAFAPAPVTVHAIATSPIDGTAEERDAVEPPRQLPEMADIEPLQAEKPREDAELRAFIRDELQTLAASEHQIWYETLHGLSREDATEILRIWKFTRGLDEPIEIPGLPKLAALTTEETASSTPSASPGRPSAQTQHATGVSQSDAILRACRHNLANAATPGFKRWDVMIFDHSANGAGDHEPLVWINQTAGKQTQTGRPYDCCIHGPGFFKVQRGSETFLTRCGRFIRCESGHLALPQPNGDHCRLQPEVVVPENCESLVIDPDGKVHVKVAGHEARDAGCIRLHVVFDPSALKPLPDNLFAMTAASGSDRPIADEGSTIWQGSVEESNVDPSAERLKIDAITARSAK